MLFLFDLASHMRRPVVEVSEWDEDELCWWWARSLTRPLCDDHGMLLRQASAISATAGASDSDRKRVWAQILPESQK